MGGNPDGWRGSVGGVSAEVAAKTGQREWVRGLENFSKSGRWEATLKTNKHLKWPVKQKLKEVGGRWGPGRHSLWRKNWWPRVLKNPQYLSVPRTHFWVLPIVCFNRSSALKEAVQSSSFQSQLLSILGLFWETYRIFHSHLRYPFSRVSKHISQVLWVSGNVATLQPHITQYNICQTIFQK